MSIEDTIIRGQQAAQLLGNETLQAVLAEIEAECLKSWAGSNPADVAVREDAYRMNRCIALVRQKLETWRGAGQYEKSNIAIIDRERRSQI